jgi:hypothetical protein
MMQSSDPRKCNDLPHFLRFDRPLFRGILFQPEVCSVRVVVVDIGKDHSPELSLIDRDHVVEAVSS